MEIHFVLFNYFTFLLFYLVPRRAKALVDEIVSRGHESSNGQSGSMQEMIIPAGKAGLIIGKGGETIKQLQVRLVVYCDEVSVVINMMILQEILLGAV